MVKTILIALIITVATLILLIISKRFYRYYYVLQEKKLTRKLDLAVEEYERWFLTPNWANSDEYMRILDKISSIQKQLKNLKSKYHA